MAISKILNMKDCGGHFHGKHLKRALDYVMNPEKTQDGRLVGAINCQIDTAFEQMKETKRKFGKIDKRQGYHIILSFKENEVNPDTAFEITQNKARERSRELFSAADEMETLKPAEQSYRLGDTFFEDEHRKWVALEQELQAQGYSLEEVQALRKHYKEEYSQVCAKEKVVFRELNTGKAILNSIILDSISDGKKTEYNREIIRDRKEQSVR